MNKQGCWRAVMLGILPLLFIGCAASRPPLAPRLAPEPFMVMPAATVERMALLNFVEQNQQAQVDGRLLADGPEYARVSAIAARITPQARLLRPDVETWKWQVALIDAPTVNATCAPGGKVTFFTGLIRQLALSDDEIAIVMGHEVAHALREHGRGRLSQAMVQNGLTSGLVAAVPGRQGQLQAASKLAHYLFMLPNSRDNESEADQIGLELAARAGYDPRAAISLWQKMASAADGPALPQFLSTHPTTASRAGELRAMMPAMLALYQTARQP